MRLPAWLERESESWQRDGLISADQRRAILARYAATAAPERAAEILVSLAVLVGGVGLILLVGFNWDRIPPAVRIAGSVALTTLLYAVSAVLAGRGRARAAEIWTFAAVMGAGAMVFAIGDVYYADLNAPLPVLVWAAVVGVTSLLAASAVTAALGAGALAWWMLLAGGQSPPPWEFLLVWPCLAIAVEQRPNRYVSGGLTLTFGMWAAFVAIDVWRYQAMAGVSLVLAGAVLDTWAHAPAAARPAFARTTPAIAVVIAGLLFLAINGTMGGPPADWHQRAEGAWPAFALMGALAAVVAWPVAARQTLSWRPVFVASVAVVWIVLWRLLPESAAASSAWRWGWLIALSAAFVIVTVTAVREAAATSDLGLFAVGLFSMVALVIVHLVHGRGDVWRAALVLLLASAVLGWIGRMWWRRAPGIGS
jgi:uncharacterized membrane protein